MPSSRPMALPRRPRFPLPPSRGTTSTRPRPLPSTPRPWLASGARQLLRAGKRVLPRSRRPSTLLLVALTSPLPTRRADLVLHACDPESPASVHAPRVLSRSAASCGRRCCNGPAALAAPHSLEHEETAAARVYVHLGQQLYRPPLVERIGTRAPACGARRTKGPGSIRPVQRGHTARLPRRRAAPASLKMAACCASQLALVPAVRRANPRCAAACAAAPAACKPQCRAQRRAGCLRLRSWHTSHLDRKAVGRLARALTNRSPRCRSAARASLAGVARPCGVRALRCVALPVVVRRSDRPLLALERVLQRVDRASRRTRAPPQARH